MKPDHLQFAQHILAGMPACQAYRAVRPKVTKSTAEKQARAWSARADVAAFIAKAKAEAEARALEASVLTILEKRQYLARAVRTPLASIDPEDPESEGADLVKSYAKTDSEMSSSTRFEKIDPLRAIALDNDLAGDGTGSNTLRELTEAIQSLAPTSTLPTGQI